MKQRITKRVIDSLKPQAKRYYVWDTEVTGFGVMVTRNGTKSYVFQYRLSGRGRSASAKRVRLGRHGDLTADQARRLAASKLLEVRAGKDPVRARQASGKPSVQDLAMRFLSEYLPNKKRPPRISTIESYESLFRCHVIPRIGEKRVQELTTDDIETLHRSMRGTPYVANRVLAVLKHALDQAEGWGWLASRGNPARHIERFPEERRGAKKEVMLTAQQMARLLEAINEEERSGANSIACNAIRVAFWTGWRIGEVLRLEWKNVDLEGGVAKLVRTKTADEEYRQLPDVALGVLRSLPKVAGCALVFPGGDFSTHLTTVRKPWVKIRDRAGLGDLDGLGPFRLHDLRHNVVSWDVSRGVPLEIAGKNVGHRSRQATEVYAHFAPDALKRAADERADAMQAAVESLAEG